MSVLDSYPRVEVGDRDAWRAWLAAHHASERGAWLVSFKQSTGRPAVGYDASVEEALCFGWIDSQVRRLDDERTMLLFTPRRPGSGWSRPNKERIARLEADGRIEPAGAEVLARAHEDGSWTLLDDVEALVVPADLAAAFDQHPSAAGQWEAFPRSAKRAALEWIVTAKRPETRAKRVAEVAAKTARGERPRT